MRSRLQFILLCFIWLIIVTVSLLWNISNIRGNTLNLARTTGRSFFREIQVTRAWNAEHGGVYVPITEQTRPNPYLKVPKRDVVTTDGIELTKINPAFMTRQIATIAAKENNIRYHITSLNPIRPANRADDWERVALASFYQKENERLELLSEERVFRYMAPLFVKKSCLQCHSYQGYKVGDIRGGISVTIPASPYLSSMNSSLLNIYIGHLLTGLFGLVGLFSFWRYKEKQLKIQSEKNRSIAEINTQLAHEREKAISASEAKGRFLANMSHEIRTPMNAIIGFSQLVAKTGLNLQQKDFISKIESSSQNLLGIINDILDFSKIEAGKLKVENIPFDLHKVMEQLGDLVRVKLGEKPVEIVFSHPEHVPHGLNGDPLRLGQILLNLVGNAVKFTEQGEIVTVVKEKRRISENRTLLEFTISDTGIGLTPAQVEHLFEAFAQGDDSTTRRYGGTGLGLTISKQLVNLMGGEINIESEFGKGTTFRFTAELGIDQSAVKKPPHIPATISGMNVLLVEDNKSSSEILQQQLKSLHFNVFTAESAGEALKLIQQAPVFPIILTDWKMPGMDGIELADAIRNMQLSPEPKIILVTAYSNDDLINKTDKIIDNVLFKPTTPSAIFNAVLATLQQVDHTEEETSPIKAELLDLSDYQLLLVEDNDINQQVAKEMLKPFNAQIEVAGNGREAIDKLMAGDFDLVLMDIEMPVMDGIESTREIRKDSRYTNLPIIALTANAISGDKERFLAAGMDDYITKPIYATTLKNVLKKWLKQDAVIKDNEAAPPVATSQLEVFNYSKGLENAANNRDLYLKMLKRFESDYHNIALTLEHHLSANSLDELKRYIHTLKGLSGTIGAPRLQSCAENLETAVKNKEPVHFERLTAELISCYMITLETIQLQQHL